MYGQRAVRIQPYDDVAAPGGVVALGVVLAPVAAAGLLALVGGGDQDAGHAQEVGGLPGVDAGLGGLAVLVEGVAGVGVQLLELSGGLGEGFGGAQDARALGHDPLDREAGLGCEQRVRGLLGVRYRFGHTRVEGVLGLARGDVGDDALGVDEAFEEGVGGEPVRAVHTGAGDLSARVQPGDGRTAPGVGADAAGRVVGGRGDRDGLGDRVDAVTAAGGEDRREAVLPHVGAEVPGVEEHVLGVLLLHAPHDALGDDVPGRQLGEFVLAHHEAHAVGVDQVSALAAHRLGDEGLLALRVRAEEQHGRVELHELQVGDLGARAERESDAVARRHGRVGGRREDLAHAAGREDHCGRVHGAHTVVLALAHDVQAHARRPPLGVGQEVQHERVLDRAQATRVYGLDERPGDLRAGRVAARVRDTTPVVTALAGQLQSSFGGLVEVGAGLDEPPYGVGALSDEDPYGLLVAQARAGDQGVVQVLFGGVALPEGRGDTALGPAGGAVVEAGLGDDDRPQPGRLAAQGRGQAGHSGADDHHVGGDGPPRGGCVQSYACAGHEAAPRVPKVSGMLSISRVVPTRAATARTASPMKSSSTSVKSDGSTRAR